MSLGGVSIDLPAFRETVEWLRACEGGGACGSWLEFCQRQGLFHVFTREYVRILAAHLSRPAHRRIVEVGSGSGRLAGAMRAEGLDVLATDPGGWEGVEPPSWVERANTAAALARHRPDLVIGSWLPVDAPTHRRILADRSVRWYCVIDHEQNGIVGAEALADAPGWTATRLADADRWALTRWDTLTAVPHGTLIQHGVTLLFSRDLS